MIIRGDGLERTKMEKPRGGRGTAFRMAYDAACGFSGEMTYFAMMQVEPDSEIGFHDHIDDMELYLVLDGVARVSDNGTMEVLNPGDMLVTKAGEGHSLINDTAEPVTFLAVIIKH